MTACAIILQISWRIVRPARSGICPAGWCNPFECGWPRPVKLAKSSSLCLEILRFRGRTNPAALSEPFLGVLMAEGTGKEAVAPFHWHYVVSIHGDVRRGERTAWITFASVGTRLREVRSNWRGRPVTIRFQPRVVAIGWFPPFWLIHHYPNLPWSARMV